MTTETNHNPDIGTEPGANWTFLEGHAHDEGLDPQPQPAHDELPGQDSGQSGPSAAAAEQDALAQQESGQAPAPAAAPVMPHDSGDALLTDQVENELFSRWTAIQNSFVEDPRTSVEDADALVQEIVATLTASLRERTNELAAAWQHGQPDTEQLRLALRQYRSFVGVVLPR